jgi:hypothetical protein
MTSPNAQCFELFAHFGPFSNLALSYEMTSFLTHFLIENRPEQKIAWLTPVPTPAL